MQLTGNSNPINNFPPLPLPHPLLPPSPPSPSLHHEMIPCTSRILKHNYCQQPNPSYPRFFTPFLPSLLLSISHITMYAWSTYGGWEVGALILFLKSHHRYTMFALLLFYHSQYIYVYSLPVLSNVYSPPILSFTIYLCLLSSCFIIQT